MNSREFSEKMSKLKTLKKIPTVNEIVINEHKIHVLKSSCYFGDYEDPALIRESVYNTDVKLNQLLENNIGEIIPSNCRYYNKRKNGDTVLIIEEPPQMRTIKLYVPLLREAEILKHNGTLERYGFSEFYKNKPQPPYQLNLSFPYILYLIRINSFKEVFGFNVYFRLHPLTSMNDYLIRPFLPNMSDSEVCTGKIKIPEKFEVRSISDLVETYINAWWEYEFNMDLNSNYLQYEKNGPPELQGYLSWAYFSQYDPMFIFGVDWLLYRSTIGKILKNYLNSRRSNNGVFHDFISRINSKQNDVDNTVYQCDEYSDELVINNSKILSVGDSVDITIDGKQMKDLYVNSFEFTKTNGDIKNIIFESNDSNELITIPFSDNLEMEIYNFLDNKINEYIKGGITYKNGDIVRLFIRQDLDYNLPQYKIFKGVRKIRDNTVEIKLGDSYYIENTIDFEKVELNEIKFSGIKLEPGKEYFINSSYLNSYNPQLCHVSLGVPSEIKISNNGIIYTHISTVNKHRDARKIIVNSDDSSDSIKSIKDTIIYEKSNMINPAIFMTGKKIYTQDLERNIWAYMTLDRTKPIFYEDIGYPDNDVLIKYFKDVAKNGHLYIPGQNEDIDLKVGDEVIVANWEFPEDMLIIQTIDRFEYVEVQNNSSYDYIPKFLYVVCKDDIGNERYYQYISMRYDGECNIQNGMIRKASIEYMGIKSGTLLRAKEPKIPMFPKKDVNYIIGFIMDTGTTPLMLCSNLCTLWATEENFEKFDFIKQTTTKYLKERQKVEFFNLNKIKLQPGDFIIYDELFTFYIKQETNDYYFTIKIYDTYYVNKYIYKYEFSRIKNYGILLPRVTVAQINNMVTKPLNVTLSGYNYIDNALQYGIKLDHIPPDCKFKEINPENILFMNEVFKKYFREDLEEQPTGDPEDDDLEIDDDDYEDDEDWDDHDEEISMTSTQPPEIPPAQLYMQNTNGD